MIKTDPADDWVALELDRVIISFADIDLFFLNPDPGPMYVLGIRIHNTLVKGWEDVSKSPKGPGNFCTNCCRYKYIQG